MNFVLTNSAQYRSVWVRNMSPMFTQVISAWNDVEFKRNFRVSRETFDYLCNKLRTKLTRDATLCVVSPVEKRVAIALWRLGTNIEYRTISHLFGVGISTACNILHEVCAAIVDTLFKIYIKVPTGNEAMQIAIGFEEKWNFLQCFGAVDGSHVPIIPPQHSAKDYVKKTISLYCSSGSS